MEIAQRKRITIIAVYFFIFISAALVAYSLWPEKETCFDGKKNQNEQDVDCGGVCQKKCRVAEVRGLIVEKTGTVASGVSGQYDFFAILSNPNAAFAGREFEFAVIFEDQEGNIISERKSRDFILPGERKYIIESNFTVSEKHSAKLEILNCDWESPGDFYEKPNLKIINKNYTEISGGTAFSEARGLLKNESPYDFDSIKIKIILKDQKGEIIALNSTIMKTVKSGEERDFKVQWPNRFSGTVENMEVQADANIF